LNFHKVGTEVLPKPLLEAINAIISEDVPLNNAVLLLKVRVVLTLLGELSNQQRLDPKDLLSGFQFFVADAITPIIKELIV
jgi:hypothetical protein